MTALTTRWMGTNASSNAHHHRRHRDGNHGPDTVSTAASSAIQRGSSRNCDSTVSRRSLRSKCQRGAAMPVSLMDSDSTLMTAAAAYAHSIFHCRRMAMP